MKLRLLLQIGSSFEGGKTRIYAFFQTPHTPKESADFLKKEYGIGGRTHAVSRESGSYEDHGSKGIVLKKERLCRHSDELEQGRFAHLGAGSVESLPYAG